MLKTSLFFMLPIILIMGCDNYTKTFSDEKETIKDITTLTELPPIQIPKDPFTDIQEKFVSHNSENAKNIASNYVGINMSKIYSDGINNGKDAYTIITEQLGNLSIEAPDLYETNHPEVKHLYEDNDDIVGNHFAFTMHLNEDGNKDEVEKKVQRNEIKVYGETSHLLKGFKDRTFLFKWKFKVDSGLSLSNHFTIFFQLKPVNPDVKSPIIMFSAAKRGSQEILEVRYKEGSIQEKYTRFDKIPFKKIEGEWFEITCLAKYSEAEDGGCFSLDMTSLENGRKIFSIKKKSLDMWTGPKTSFIRPKWGIVRSLQDKNSLRTQEEIVRLADIEITEIINEKENPYLNQKVSLGPEN